MFFRLSNLMPLIKQTDYKIDKDNEFCNLSLCAEKLNFPCCVFVEDVMYVDTITDNAVMVLAAHGFDGAFPSDKSYGICFVDNPRITFFCLHNYLSQVDGYKLAARSTRIGNNCKISPLAVIAENNVNIGDNVIIEEFVVIRENTVIGDNSIIRAGVVIGGEGFEFKRDEGKILAITHAGGVIIGHDVEIQYNSCVDRAVYPWDNTVIGNYTKIDNLIQVSHAAKIGNNVLIAASSFVGGRTRIDDNAWVGAGVTISNALTVGANSRANIGSVVTKNVDNNESVTGNFAIPHHKFIRNLRIVTRDGDA